MKWKLNECMKNVYENDSSVIQCQNPTGSIALRLSADALTIIVSDMLLTNCDETAR